MNFTYFIGIDVSKKTLDVSFCIKGKPEHFYHIQVENSLKGFKKILSWLKKHKVKLERSFFAMEHTGVYSLPLSFFLQEHDIAFRMYNPLELKRSLGLQRGKNDKVDSQRIAHYIFLHRHGLKTTQLPSVTLGKLKNLLAFRDRLIKSKVIFQQSIHDLKATKHLIDNAFIIEKTQEQLDKIKEDIKEVEKQIRQTIDSEQSLKNNFKLACTVPGIALITAAYLLVHTHNFSAFHNGRQFNAYCGIAPYEYSSGSSIKGKTRNSPLANKKIKTLLANGANSVINHNIELKEYYTNKVAAGKSEMSVLNAVKAKMIARVFAVVKRGTEYKKDYQAAQAA